MSGAVRRWLRRPVLGPLTVLAGGAVTGVAGWMLAGAVIARSGTAGRIVVLAAAAGGAAVAVMLWRGPRSHRDARPPQ